MLGMEIFHFGKEIFILFGHKVAFGEVSGGPGRTVIPNFRYKRQKDDTDHLNKQQPSTHADIFMRGMLIEMIEGPLQWIITHTVVIKSFIFFFPSRKRLGTYTAQHRTPAPLQHSADTATCNNNNYAHYTQTLCTRGTGGEVWSFFFFLYKPSFSDVASNLKEVQVPAGARQEELNTPTHAFCILHCYSHISCLVMLVSRSVNNCTLQHLDNCWTQKQIGFLTVFFSSTQDQVFIYSAKYQV